MLRLRALDEVSDNLASVTIWKSVNEMFETYVPIIDSALGSGTRGANMLYVPCKDEQEQEEKKVCELLFSTNININTKRYILRGAVGTGKTTLVNRICHKTLSDTFPDSYVLAAYKDTQRIASCKAAEIFQAMTEELRKSIIKTLFPYAGGELNLYIDINSQLQGAALAKADARKNPRQVIENGRRIFTLSDYCEFLSRVSAQGKKVYVLMVMDNIDENSSDAIKEILSAENQLFETLSKEDNNFFASTLLPMRDYTKKTFASTIRYAVSDMFQYPASEILRERLKFCKNQIRNSTRMFNYNGKTINPEDVADFIANLADALLSKKQPETFMLISNLAANNMKILLGNIYNMIHSPRLPYARVFESAFEKKESYQTNHVIPMEIACQCMMAVHYPFFDVRNSYVMNLFNVKVLADGFMNTLVIYRFMCLVNRYKKIAYKNIIEEFDSIGYDSSFVDQSITLCLEHGAIEASNGLTFEHINDTTEFKWNSSTKTYLEKLLYSLSYLQYACEDTPMPAKHIVKITDKYSVEVNDSYENFRNSRFNSALRFCKFLKEEEDLEWDHVERNPKNVYRTRHDFNTQWSLNLKGGDYLADKIEFGIREQINMINNAHQYYRY